MAKITFRRSSNYGIMLGKLADTYWIDHALKEAVQKGSAVIADEIRKNLDNLPEDKFHYLADGEMFAGVPRGQKKDLADSFGLTPIERDRDGFIHTKAGFDGYGSYPTNEFPKGVPNELLARVVESGSSVRVKTPFVEPAIKAKKKEAMETMGKVIDEKIKPFI